MRLAHPTSPNDQAWLQLRAKLWPHVHNSEHVADLELWLQAGHFACVAFVDQTPVGLAEASCRTDYVNGTSTSPIAFLEGLYVVPDYRRRGVASSLVAEVRRWAHSRGFTELASDAVLDNTVSHAVHRALGFVETERVVYFNSPVFVA